MSPGPPLFFANLGKHLCYEGAAVVVAAAGVAEAILQGLIAASHQKAIPVTNEGVVAAASGIFCEYPPAASARP